jgi:hypothetical protein
MRDLRSVRQKPGQQQAKSDSGTIDFSIAPGAGVATVPSFVVCVCRLAGREVSGYTSHAGLIATASSACECQDLSKHVTAFTILDIYIEMRNVALHYDCIHCPWLTGNYLTINRHPHQPDPPQICKRKERGDETHAPVVDY